jgi:hypothetical protein
MPNLKVRCPGVKLNRGSHSAHTSLNGARCLRPSAAGGLVRPKMRAIIYTKIDASFDKKGKFNF